MDKYPVQRWTNGNWVTIASFASLKEAARAVEGLNYAPANDGWEYRVKVEADG